MLVISLITLIEQSGDIRTKKLVGDIRSWAKAFEPECLERLQQQWDGVFAFLAFHPGADTPIVDYIRRGTFSSDTGPRVLALFTLNARAGLPVSLVETSFDGWLGIKNEEHPAYKMLRVLFEPKASPALPGIVFFGTFLGPEGAVYVPLEDCSEESSVRRELRRLFALANEVANEIGDKTKFSKRMAARLQANRVRYFQSSRISMRQVLIKSYQFIADNKADIVAIVGSLGL